MENEKVKYIKPNPKTPLEQVKHKLRDNRIGEAEARKGINELLLFHVRVVRAFQVSKIGNEELNLYVDYIEDQILQLFPQPLGDKGASINPPEATTNEELREKIRDIASKEIVTWCGKDMCSDLIADQILDLISSS